MRSSEILASRDTRSPLAESCESNQPLLKKIPLIGHDSADLSQWGCLGSQDELTSFHNLGQGLCLGSQNRSKRISRSPMKHDERVCKILKLFLELNSFLFQGIIFNKTM